MLDDSTSQLRIKLDNILKECQAQSEQVDALKSIERFHPHSIRPARLDDFIEIGDANIPDYDCFTFALDLIDSQERLAVRDFAPKRIGPIQRPGIADVIPGPNFVHYLQLSKRFSYNECQDHDLAIYSDAFGKIRHIGKVLKENIYSKWGMKGYLWQHGIWEVPNSYGVEVHFYAKLDKSLIKKQWNAYLYDLAKRVRRFTTIILENAQQPL